MEDKKMIHKQTVDKGWDQMRVLLDQKMPEKKRRRGGFFLWFGVGLSLILISTLFFTQNKYFTNKNTYTSTNQEIIKDNSTSDDSPTNNSSSTQQDISTTTNKSNVEKNTTNKSIGEKDIVTSERLEHNSLQEHSTHSTLQKEPQNEVNRSTAIKTVPNASKSTQNTGTTSSAVLKSNIPEPSPNLDHKDHTDVYKSDGTQLNPRITPSEEEEAITNESNLAEDQVESEKSRMTTTSDVDRYKERVSPPTISDNPITDNNTEDNQDLSTASPPHKQQKNNTSQETDFENISKLQNLGNDIQETSDRGVTEDDPLAQDTQSSSIQPEIKSPQIPIKELTFLPIYRSAVVISGANPDVPNAPTLIQTRPNFHLGIYGSILSINAKDNLGYNAGIFMRNRIRNFSLTWDLGYSHTPFDNATVTEMRIVNNLQSSPDRTTIQVGNTLDTFSNVVILDNASWVETSLLMGGYLGNDLHLYLGPAISFMVDHTEANSMFEGPIINFDEISYNYLGTNRLLSKVNFGAIGGAEYSFHPNVSIYGSYRMSFGNIITDIDRITTAIDPSVDVTSSTDDNGVSGSTDGTGGPDGPSGPAGPAGPAGDMSGDIPDENNVPIDIIDIATIRQQSVQLRYLKIGLRYRF